jgi:flagellar basal body-associated protein FliL
MESTANINDTNTDGVFNKKNVKIRYILNGITLTENLELYDDSKLEQAFEDYKRQKNINDMQNQRRQTVFHLIKENGKINLDKNKKIQELGLQEGDLIEITYHDSPNLHIPSNSKDNLVSSPQPNNKKKFIIISVIVVAIVIGLTVFLLLWLLFHNKNKKNEQNKSNSQNKEKGNNQTPKDVSESEQNNKLKNSNKNYTKEKLISEKRPYYPNNTLFLYKSIKEMNVAIEGISENLTDAENMTKLREYMDFSLLIQEENEEIDEINEIKKIWYSGFISLYNITINDGTNDTTLLFNEEIYKYVDDKKSRIVEEELESKKIIKQPEPLFAKINFYENGEIKEIFIPNEFNISNIFYIEKIIKFIIPKLSTHLYSKNFNEELELIEKLLRRVIF